MPQSTRFRKVLLRLLLPVLALSSQIVCGASSEAQNTQQSSPRASTQNLARWNMGAKLILVEDGHFQYISVSDIGDFNESIFLSSNAGLSFQITEGSHNYIIDLGKTARLSCFGLKNRSAKGSFELFTATRLDQLDSPIWHKLEEATAIIPGVLPAITFPEIKARYLLIRFKIETAGKIGHFDLLGH